MTEKFTCPFCLHEITFKPDQCPQCGQVLNAITTVWKTHDELPDMERPVLPALQFATDTLYLYVSGLPNQSAISIRMRDKQAVVLGRATAKSFTSPLYLVDLSPYEAFSRGVSRKHAYINYDGSGYTVEDLASSNGTWLNENRLLPRQPYPLHSGDYLQLGELLLFVYYV